MYDTAERIRLVKQRAGKMRQKRERRSLGALFVLCLILSLALLLTFASVTGGQRGASVREMMGATLMFEDAGAYVLVGIISFTAAVIITVLCLRQRHKAEMSRKDNSQQENSRMADE